MKKTTLLLARFLARRSCLLAALALLATVAFGPLPAQAAVTEAWVHRYNGPADSDDRGRAVAVDGSGNVVVTGYSDNGTNTDFYTAKYAAADGALQWEGRYNGPLNGQDYVFAVAVDGSGNVVVTGVTDAIFPCYDCGWVGDYYTAKYAAADGVLLWEQRYNGPGDDTALAVAVDGSGNVVVTGYSVGTTNRNYDYYTAKYAAADGALLWDQRYNGPANTDDRAQAVAVDGSSNVVVTGYSYNGTNYDYCTVKYAAADGTLLWEKRGPGGGAAAVAVAVDGSGNVVVTGNSWNGINTDYYTAKYATADGALLWEKCYNGPANNSDRAQAVAVEGGGNVVVTGSSDNGNSFDSRTSDYYTAKYAAADGALLWEQRYNGPANGDDRVGASDYFPGASRCLALGPNGMVAITGSSSGDYATVVYRDDVYPISIALVPAGVRLRFIGIPGRSYTIERAPAVAGPWSTLSTQTAPASGLIEHFDAPPPAGQAFYRTTQP